MHQILILINQVEYVLFLRLNGECIKKQETAEKQQNFTYTAGYKYGHFTGKSMSGWKS